MSDRRKKAAGAKFFAITAAVLIHAVLIVVLLFNYNAKTTKVEAFDADKVDVVKATTIDESQIKKQQDKIKQQDLDKKRKEEQEKKRLADLKKQAELEKKRIAELKEKQKQEEAKAVELEKQRKEIALKQAQEKAKREKEALEEKKRLAEQKKKEEAERKRLQALAEKKKREEEQARKEQEERERALQQSFADQLAAEEAKQRTTTLVNRHAAMVRDAINDKRTIAPDFESYLVAKLQIKLNSYGDVESVSVVQSSGNARYDQDAERAVLKASPLPIPSLEEDESAHKTFRDMILTIKMPGA